MRYTWIVFGLAALLTLAAGLSRSAAEERSDLKDDLQRIGHSLEDLAHKLDGFQESVRLSFKIAQQDADDLRKRVAHLEAEVERLKGRSTVNGTQSFYMPPAATTGTILLDNHNAAWTATVSINGVSHVVPPLSSQRINGVPAGAFTYSVIATDPFGRSVLSAPVTARTLTAGAEFPITINPS
jgi:hypothetical protein